MKYDHLFLDYLPIERWTSSVSRSSMTSFPYPSPFGTDVPSWGHCQQNNKQTEVVHYLSKSSAHLG